MKLLAGRPGALQSAKRINRDGLSSRSIRMGSPAEFKPDGRPERRARVQGESASKQTSGHSSWHWLRWSGPKFGSRSGSGGLNEVSGAGEHPTNM